MKIKEVSEYLGVSTHTLRYYEKVGLLYPIQKNGSGMREYHDEDLSRLKFILCMRSADVSIQILKQYITLLDQPTDTKDKRKALLNEQYDLMKTKYKDLKAGLDYLEHKINLLEDDKLMIKEIQ